jgi:hypothetical protein
MSKHHSKNKHTGAGVKHVGNPASLIALLTSDTDEKKWATNEIVNEGPRHKQVLSALLLVRLNKLVKSIEKSTGATFVVQKGYEVCSDKEDKEVVLPVPMPIHLAPGMDEEKVIKAIAHAPAHEALAYVMCLQVIEWAIKVTSKPKIDHQLALAE